MGTRGLRIVLFCNRCFVYYNDYDSYPEGLGRELLSNIPTDLEQYKVWLERERAFYGELTTQLETKVLTVSEDKMRGLLAKDELPHEGYGELQAQPAWKELDSELQELPTALCDARKGLMIEWVYVIDLDNELFSVDNWIFFDLWDIPRDRWIEAFSCEDDSPKVFSFEICPEGSCGVDLDQYFANEPAGERDKYHAVYQQYSHSTVKPIGEIDVSSRAALQQILAIVTFEMFTSPFGSHFWEYLPGWGQEHFAFREIAFAILSFAAGQLYLDNPDRFYGRYRKHESDGYLVDRNDGGEPKLMPIWSSGCHRPDQEPGSAPPGSIYWFENVLISLVPDAVFEKDMEAAVAKAVEYGLDEGKVSFQIVLFSILNAVMLDVRVKDGVKLIRHTNVVPIYKTLYQDVSEWGGKNDREDYASSPLEYICRKRAGFISLQNFFRTAANRHLSIYGQGRFPVEIYANIVANADLSTRNACAKVSQVFHALCKERVSFSENLTILNVEPPTKSQIPKHRRPWVSPHDIGTFTFQDQNTGQIMRSGLDVRKQVLRADEKKVRKWCPVVGGVARPSMMTQFPFRVLLQTQD